MQWDHVILNGTLVTATDTFKGNIYVKDGKIFAITEGLLEGDAKETTDAAGKYVLPGFIDSHVHSRDGKFGAHHKEDFFHSSMAGACGGVTTIIEQPNSNPAVYNVEMMDSLIETIGPKAHVDFGNWGLCIGKLNNGELMKLKEHGAAAFKFFVEPMIVVVRVGIKETHLTALSRPAAFRDRGRPRGPCLRRTRGSCRSIRCRRVPRA